MRNDHFENIHKTPFIIVGGLLSVEPFKRVLIVNFPSQDL